ncbi:phytanoyl-CoA dioxygenase family protein [Oceaniserpentilla sp. 4NH20-0058]|uniref:phytanoyl-CoA dioxygenase family protein n=1 Tax=Oceaniserpentilla sp. 4NH20-0058 TaxID=3127660 RepID=UPI003106D590
MGLLSIFTSSKSFALPIIGSTLLNGLGLHVFRIRLANAFLALRRVQVGGLSRPIEYKTFKKDGVLVLENFLPEDQFKTLTAEIKQTMSAADQTTPIQNYGDLGFGQKHSFDWGFDRYDGDTLNRFYNIDSKQTSVQGFLDNPKLKQLTSLCAGTYHDKDKYFLYKLLHGEEAQNQDIQKAIHRDTFHSAIKLWYFIEDVTPEHGPFSYAKGSNHMDTRRLSWEKRKSIEASQANKGGAFRITPEELNQLNSGELSSFPVKANTLVLADIRGFHCRGQALANQQRLSIYANIRPAPFLPAFHTGKLKQLRSRITGFLTK